MTASESTDRPASQPVPLWSLLLKIPPYILVLGAIMFAVAGGLNWTTGWLYLAAYLVVVLVGVLVVPIDRELAEERSRIKRDVKGWDKAIGTILSVVVPGGLPVLAGLDFRFGWSPRFALWISLLAVLPYALGIAVSYWAAVANKFFARYVRIQTERGHHVVDGGPYRFVRHPGYLGLIVTTLAIPLVLGSLWSFTLAGAMALLGVARTALEDRTLRAELPGYADYATRTRFRLLPGIW